MAISEIVWDVARFVQKEEDTMKANKNLDRAQIRALRDEAATAGDDAMVRIADRALELGEDSSEWRECERVIADAAAMA